MKITSSIRHIRIRRIPVRLTLALGMFTGAVILLFILATTTTPDEVGPLGVTAAFILVFVVALTALTLLKMIARQSTVVTVEGLVGWALIPTLFLALGTLKQLTVVDVLLILMFVVLLSFYIKRATKNSQT